MKQVNSLSEFKTLIKGQEKSFLLLYKSGSENSDCAYRHIDEASNMVDDVQVYVADVNVVRDIHVAYNITTAPSLLEFEKGEFKNIIKGCNNVANYKSYFEDAVYIASINKEDKPSKRVTVYSTPTCSWCNTLKSHLRMHKIRFTDVDVSADQQAAEAMVRRSGQQGVPQTDINGEMIIGFNKARINELLGINN
jgi:glutaredoxin-like YruB-family protein